jgi:large subunit ribosomal protein L31
MRPKIHPKYYLEARVTCACGNTWVTGSTKETIRTDVCSNCHPYFTGQSQRLVDTAGQVERFTKRVEQAKAMGREAKRRAVARVERERARALVEIVDEEEAVEPIEAAEEDQAEA